MKKFEFKYQRPAWLPEETAWDKLSLDEKAAMIKVAVKNGITWMDDIKQKYNEFAAGGNIYDGTKEETQKMQIGRNYWQSQTSQPSFFNLDFPVNGGSLSEIVVTGKDRRRERLARMQEVLEQRRRDYLTESNDNTWIEQPLTYKKKNPHLAQRAIEGAKAHAAWAEANPVLNAVGMGLGAAPLAVAAIPALAAAGEAAAPVLANPYVDALLTSGFAAHGLNHAINEGVDGWGDAALTALEIAPLGRAVKPVVQEATSIFGRLSTSRPQTAKVIRPIPELFESRVDWTPDNWFKNISDRNSYTAEEAEELASFVPEYREIERQLVKNGDLITDASGNLVVKGSDMSPQEYIMRQSKNFTSRMNPEHHYVGVSSGKVKNFEEGKYSDFDAWTTKTSPKDVEEYAVSPGGGHTYDSLIEQTKHQMTIREENYALHQEQLKWKLDHGKITQEMYDRDMKDLKDMYEWKQQVAKDELAQYARQQQLDPLNGGKVYDITYPQSARKAPVVDAQGAHWQHIPYENNGNPITTSTDHIVSANKGLGYNITSIDNVMDTYNGTLLNEEIIHRGTPIKSVLGNTGAFDITGPNKFNRFRGLFPWLGGPSLLGIGYFASDSH